MNYIEDFKQYYKEEKERLENRLSKFNKDLVHEQNSIIKENLQLLSNLNSDGKLVRGILVKLGYYLLNNDRDYANDLALAYEIFQTAILVHDDVIDNDNKRRGKDTIHYASYNKYEKYSKDVAKHLSESIAICVGDYGLYEANKLIVDKYAKDANLAGVLSNFNQTVLTTIKGELIDVILPFKSKYNLVDNKEIEESILEIYRLKTSYYTIIGPLTAGILLAGGNEKKLKDIEKFGEKVGIAFQIQDDILGIYSDEMGKIKGSDIKEFKQTILYSHIIRTKYKDEFLNYYGCETLSAEGLDKVKDLLIQSKSYDYSNNMMNQMYDEALDILDNINWINIDKKELLRGFVEYLRSRKK